jgi:histidyl-tRNA synthetase
VYQAPRGTQDILPEEQPYWRFLEKAIEEVTRLYGYHRIDTPTFEETALFSRGVGEGTDIVDKEMYTFDDKGGKSMTLKPEGTASICRAYIQQGMASLPQPVKLYGIAPGFRYERPQAGRLREFHQFGCEAIGDDDPALDAEVIDMAWNFFKSVGLDKITLQLNSIGCKVCRPQYLEELKKYYRQQELQLCNDCKNRLEKNPLRLLDCKQEACQKYADNAPRSNEKLCPDCAAHFEQVKKYLNILGIPFLVNHRLVRGLDYYTRTIFEVQPEIEGGQSTIGGGGRYDGLIEELGGKPTPAIGFATGLERIILNIKRQDIKVPLAPGLKVYMAFMGEAAKEAAFKLTADLRKAGVSVLTATGSKSLKAQLRSANNAGAEYAVIIGEEEVKAGTVVLRHMADAVQETIEIGAVAGKLSKTG